ncbi:MAG: outer rane efflux protein [Gemmatimonadetes bacterium]|jgi:outer membrane protein|nr:outer rane efflux protein [Gemmatimonadota bacterium]
MRTLVLAALVLAAASPAARAQNGTLVPVAPAPAASAAAGAPLSLEDAVTTARRNNPVFQSQMNARRTADASVRSARGAYLPSADVSFGGRYQQGGQQYFNGAALGANSDAIQGSYGLNLNYRVNSATFVQPKAAMAQREAVEADITGSAEQLRAVVTQQYLTVLQAQARSALQDTLLITAQTQLDLAKAKVAVGSGTILDIRRAEVALGQTQVALLRARNDVQVERVRLFQQMGVAQAGPVLLTTEFPIVAPTASLDSLLELARRQNPAVLALRSRERAAELNTRVAKALYTPTLSLSTGFGGTSYQYTDANYLVSQQQLGLARAQAGCFQQDSLRVAVGLPSANCNGPAYTLTADQAAAIRSTNGQFFKYARTPFGLSAQLSLPVFDNFSREERVQRAQVDREDAAFSVRAKDLALVADVTQAYLTLTTAAQTVALQEQNASKAKEEVAFAEERYRVGASTFLDVVTSRGSYEQALIDRVNAVYDYHKAFAALENAVGRPLR